MKKLLSLLALGLVASLAQAQNAEAPKSVPAVPVAPKQAAPARPATPAPTLKAGDTVSPEVLGKLTWLQGEAPKEWEPGKVYILECWAVWCGPCVAAIPHVNELHKTYGPKGLRVLGVNVWEDGQEKVSSFVKGKGEGMSYPVAYTGKGGLFETEWLKPAGVTGIPNAFVVKDGKLLFRSHPMQLTNEVIESLLAGGEAQAKAVDSINQIAKNRESLAQVTREFRAASQSTNLDLMEKALAETEKLDPKYLGLSSMRLEILVIRKDWAKVEESLGSLPAGPMRVSALISANRLLNSQPETPVKLWGTYAGLLGAELPKQPQATIEYTYLAVAHWKAGDKAAALAAAQAGLKAVQSQPKSRMPVSIFENYVKTLEEGRLPTPKEVSEWYRAGMPKLSGNAN